MSEFQPGDPDIAAWKAGNVGGVDKLSKVQLAENENFTTDMNQKANQIGKFRNALQGTMAAETHRDSLAELGVLNDQIIAATTTINMTNAPRRGEALDLWSKASNIMREIEQAEPGLVERQERNRQDVAA